MVDIARPATVGPSPKKPALKVTGMPGKHVPPGPLSFANDLIKAVPPTNGWMLELGYVATASSAGGGRCRLVHGGLPHLHLGRHAAGARAVGDPEAVRGAGD